MAIKLLDVRVGSVVLKLENPSDLFVIHDTLSGGEVGISKIKPEGDRFTILGYGGEEKPEKLILTPRSYPAGAVEQALLAFYNRTLGGNVSDRIVQGIHQEVTSPPRKVRINLD